MTYVIRWKSRAEKAFLALPRRLRDVIERHVDKLVHDPRPVGCRKMAGFRNMYRIRVGDHRVVYSVHDDVLIILVVAVGARGGVYRQL